MQFLKQPLILTFFRHKSATTCQIDSSKVSNSQLDFDLCNCAKTDIIESKGLPQKSAVCMKKQKSPHTVKASVKDATNSEPPGRSLANQAYST